MSLDCGASSWSDAAILVVFLMFLFACFVVAVKNP